MQSSSTKSVRRLKVREHRAEPPKIRHHDRMFRVLRVQILVPENREQFIVHRGEVLVSSPQGGCLPLIESRMNICGQHNLRDCVVPIMQGSIQEIITPYRVFTGPFRFLEKALEETTMRSIFPLPAHPNGGTVLPYPRQ